MTSWMKPITALALAGSAILLRPAPVEACGGFFCGQQPVDQNAERVIFAVDRDAGTTDMIVQIAFQGNAVDFAWIVPLGAVPESLGTFPEAAMTALDANSAPQVWGGGCGWELDASAGPPSGGPGRDGEVIVHTREVVGPYDTAVIESTNPDALVEWLRTNEFRVTSPMEPYIADYTAAGMKFLALRLTNESKVGDIEPFRMTLPGTSPVVPLKMTALAAEPEMGIVVFILGDQRYEGANWPNLEVDPADLVYDWRTGQHNWVHEVARVVDEAGGQGWVTETATPTDSYISRLEATSPADEEQAEAVDALLDLMRPHPYISRLYTRLSAEEMVSDPIFRRSAGADVERWREIPYDPDDDECVWDGSVPATSACDFIACGVGGTCAEVTQEDGTVIAGCACVPGATARTTLAPDGTATVACQDMRMSFLNPGDREVPGATPLPDPCVGFDCGAGTCVPMNMTPTCVCDRGLVAVGAIDFDAGTRSTECVRPDTPIESGFYGQRLPERPLNLPGGREVDTPVEPGPSTFGGGGCAAGGTGASGFGLMVLALAFLRRRR
jgi:MYXO-CTERM domain-containing protein